MRRDSALRCAELDGYWRSNDRLVNADFLVLSNIEKGVQFHTFVEWTIIINTATGMKFKEDLLLKAFSQIMPMKPLLTEMDIGEGMCFTILPLAGTAQFSPVGPSHGDAPTHQSFLILDRMEKDGQTYYVNYKDAAGVSRQLDPLYLQPIPAHMTEVDPQKWDIDIVLWRGVLSDYPGTGAAMCLDHVAAKCNAGMSPDLSPDLQFFHLVLGIRLPVVSGSARREQELVIATILHLPPNHRASPSGKPTLPKHAIWATFGLMTISPALVTMRPCCWQALVGPSQVPCGPNSDKDGKEALAQLVAPRYCRSIRGLPEGAEVHPVLERLVEQGVNLSDLIYALMDRGRLSLPNSAQRWDTLHVISSNPFSAEQLTFLDLSPLGPARSADPAYRKIDCVYGASYGEQLNLRTYRHHLGLKAEAFPQGNTIPVGVSPEGRRLLEMATDGGDPWSLSYRRGAVIIKPEQVKVIAQEVMSATIQEQMKDVKAAMDASTRTLVTSEVATAVTAVVGSEISTQVAT